MNLPGGPPGQQNPFAFAVPSGGSQPIIISPVFTQSIGDISAGGGPGSNFVPNLNADPAPIQTPPPTGLPTQTTTVYVNEEMSTSSTEKDLLIAEIKERLRSSKVLLKAAEKDLDREKYEHENILRDATNRLNHERLEFTRERDDIVTRYEEALKSKDAARQDIMDQLNVLQQILQSNVGNSRTLEMDAPENLELAVPTGDPTINPTINQTINPTIMVEPTIDPTIKLKQLLQKTNVRTRARQG